MRMAYRDPKRCQPVAILREHKPRPPCLYKTLEPKIARGSHCVWDVGVTTNRSDAPRAGGATINFINQIGVRFVGELSARR